MDAERMNRPGPDNGGRRVMVIATMTSPSGAPIAALRLANGLAAIGWDARAVFLYHREDMDAADHPYECLMPHPPRGPIDHVRIVSRLYRLLRTARPDATIGFLPLASVLGAAVSRAVGIPVRVVSHRVPRQTYGAAMRRLDTASAHVGFYTDVVAVSGSVANSCASYPDWLKRRTKVVYNGLRGWRPSELGKDAARARLGLPADATIVASVGRLDHQKNYPLLISAIAEAPDTLIAAIAGEGPLRGDLVTLAAKLGVTNRVRFLGALSRSEVPHLLAAADVFAQTSTFEGQSNALLEALHAGLPCLVGDVPEQVETVREEAGRIAGAILPLNRPKDWAAAMLALGEDGPARERATNAANDQARLFSYERMIGGFDQVLRDASDRNRTKEKGARIEFPPYKD